MNEVRGKRKTVFSARARQDRASPAMASTSSGGNFSRSAAALALREATARVAFFIVRRVRRHRRHGSIHIRSFFYFISGGKASGGEGGRRRVLSLLHLHGKKTKEMICMDEGTRRHTVRVRRGSSCDPYPRLWRSTRWTASRSPRGSQLLSVVTRINIIIIIIIEHLVMKKCKRYREK